MSADSYFRRQGADIAYQFSGSGSGPAVGYAHGVLLSRAAVRDLHLLDIDGAAHGRRLLTYDQRGHGRSTGRPIVDDYRFDNFSRDLLGLMDFVGIEEPTDFVGSSLGCDVALRSSIAAPHRFRRLVLMIPPVAWESGPGSAQHWYVDAADAIESAGPDAWIDHWAHSDPPAIFADYPEFGFTPDVPHSLLAPILRGIGLSDLPAPEAIATLRHPTLILAWDTDPLHPVSTARTLHNLIPDSMLHVSSSVEDVRTWTERIAAFLAI
ncbi:alpha/beta hydrolase [Rhodococcus sp. ABRD24]|uniref:alpha/beta fold hydrolase n=1 Tax=Rhodococcus sp. ABRD24 TaxID=2507582 RepID=UPI00103EF5D1|nr:alpha/beta hydrolase [Rhodococcus sp. ABRD24]QBJ96018.1 alpha/beta hydrolase [Rhodococcus sp. ABRD24]